MKRLIYISLGLLVLFCASFSAKADIIAYKDSADFNYKYEMNVNPSGQDLDSNSVSDWFSGVAGSQTIPQTYTGGVAQSDQSASTPENLFRTDYGGSITRATLGAATPWTLEMRVRKVSGTQGSDGWFGSAFQNPGANFSARANFEDDRVSYHGAGGDNVDYMVGTDFTSGFHTMRIAFEGNDNTDATQ